MEPVDSEVGDIGSLLTNLAQGEALDFLRHGGLLTEKGSWAVN
jgi:hypothetical protein